MNRIALGLLLLLVFAASQGTHCELRTANGERLLLLLVSAAPQGTAETQQQSGRAQPERRALDDFQLPPKTVFDKAMPRYPNLWFYLDTALAASYTDAVKVVTDNLRSTMLLRESYGPFDNPEGCDFEVTLEHLQPWIVREHRALQHAHAFHMRYYFTALARNKLETVKLVTAQGERAYYRFGASVHYEVEHANPNHADVEICPICGRTGEYANLKGNLVELVHDPLGLELVLTGKIRGAVVRFEDQAQHAVGSVDGLKEKFVVQQFLFPAQSGDRNTLRIGVVVINNK